MGLDPLIPRGKVRCRKACRARSDRVRFAPFVRVRTTWNCRVADPTWKTIESLHRNYAAKCKTGFVACWWSKFDWSVFGMWVAPKSLVGRVKHMSWMKVPFQLPDLQFYEAARWCCHILTEFCLIPLWDWTFATWWFDGMAKFWPGWPSSGWQVVYKSFLLEFASASFHGIFFARDLQAQEEGPFQFLKSSQAMAGGGRRMKKTRQTTDIKWPLWQHLWHLLKRLWLLQDGLVSSHVPSLQKLHPLKQNRSSVDMFFNGSGSMVFIPFILRFLNRESTLLEWVALLLGSEDERKATQAGTVRAESTLPNLETIGNSLKLNCHKQPWTKCDA